MNINDFITVLEQKGLDPQQTGNYWMCKSPLRDEKHPSLKISEGNDGKILLNDFGDSGNYERVVTALGLKSSDLFSNNGNHKPKATKKFNKRHYTAVYEYKDESGQPYRIVGRTKDKRFYQGHWDGTQYVYDVGNKPSIPYRLNELSKVPIDAFVCIPEGEKDVDNLLKIGMPATTNPGGGGNFSPEMAKYFTDRYVVILSDNDAKGKKHVAVVGKTLQNIAKEIRVVSPELGGWDDIPGGDVSDLIEKLGDDKKAFQAIGKAIEAAPHWQPETIEENERFRFMSFHEVVNMPPKKWYVENHFGPGDVGMFFGDAATGKTFVACDLSMESIFGGKFAGKFEITQPLSVLYLTDEGLQSFGERIASIATSKNLYDAYGKRYDESCQNFWLVPDMLNLFDGNKTVTFFEDGEAIESISDIDAFCSQAKKLDPNLVIVDTLANATVGADENSNRDANLVAQNVKHIIRELGDNTAFLILHHVSKGTGDYRGASAFKGHCDFMWKLRADDSNENAAILEHYKSKHSKQVSAMRCTRVRHEGFYYPVLEWSDYIPPSVEETEQQKDDILSLFDEVEDWTIAGLKNETGIPESSLKRRLDELTSEFEIERYLEKPEKQPGNHNPWHYKRLFIQPRG